MKTIVLEQPGQFSLQQTTPPDAPGRDEALVRVRRVGICGTDLHAFEGVQPFFSYPRILGHELAVEIEAIGVTAIAHDFSVGDICAVRPYMNCGKCIACRRGRTNACEKLAVLGVHRDGGMREFINVPLDKLHKAVGLSVDHLALVEMLSIGAHAVRRAQIEAGENVIVVGAGPIGMGTAQFARASKAHVTILDINPARLAFCREQMGFEQTLDARQLTPEQLRDFCDGDLPTAVFDATGSRKAMEKAFQYVAHGGRLIYVGLVKDDITFHNPYFHSHEITLLSSRNATAIDFDRVIADLASGAVSLEGWITHEATPEALIDEFADWLKPETGVIKALLRF